MIRLLISILAVTILLPSQVHAKTKSESETQLQKEIKEVLIKNPELIIGAFKGHEDKLYDLMQVGLEKKNKDKIRNRQIAQVNNPNIPATVPNRPVWGATSGDISIFAYSDFQSATCSKADATIQKLLKSDPKISYRYRHNPQGFHKMSRPAALYYEAIVLQNFQKAIAFNKLALAKRSKIKKHGLKELDAIALKVGANVTRIHIDIKSPKVIKTVNRDIKEAKSFGFTASPVFVVNGVTITGAAPIEEFQEVIKIIRDHNLK
ncbi:DsbA family protein [Maridesulfovibrio frigidus]|uniref:DsbA family protein n=1 Tax=Maridesulfovibrio frigidus TaxID=340956 RepID=UPI0004E2075E|nr:thioredoxin domain-containing protein [Maridesulfovibrio frigidus]